MAELFVAFRSMPTLTVDTSPPPQREAKLWRCGRLLACMIFSFAFCGPVSSFLANASPRAFKFWFGTWIAIFRAASSRQQCANQQVAWRSRFCLFCTSLSFALDSPHCSSIVQLMRPRRPVARRSEGQPVSCGITGMIALKSSNKDLDIYCVLTPQTEHHFGGLVGCIGADFTTK